MVRTSGIREKLRSNVLKELAKERGIKRAKEPDEDKHNEDNDERNNSDTIAELEEARRLKKVRNSKNSLLSILPEPKHSSAFGPTVKLDKLLKKPERADEHLMQGKHDESAGVLKEVDGIIEFDASKVVSDVMPSAIKDLTIERSQSKSVILPKGKEKQKNQITYLAQLGKATELERKDQAAQSRLNKAAARSKYGW